ncbi:MAG TPA: hypothetical protein VG841_08090 [Caulobacterales bacterium]|nr:hypothetical protein [Caulobacterales bacterium]
MAKKPAEPQPHGDFDSEVDSARRRLEAALKDDDGEFDDLAALQALAPLLEDKIKSRRLSFALTGDDDDDETSIAVIHIDTDEELGFIFAEHGEYVFESNLDAYFDDFVDEDAESFVARLYETLRADLPKYEVENKG